MIAQFHLWLKSSLIAAVLAFAASGTAGAATIQLRAWLNGAQEVPSVATSATGMATVTYNTVSGELSWNVTYSGLSSPINGAHFHGPTPAGFDANITVPMSHGSSPIVGSATISLTQAAELLSGQWYINLHSDNFASGEIRGQVLVVRGDLNGDGQADVAWWNVFSGEIYLWPMNGTAILASEGDVRQVDDQNWQIAGIGDFDGDGRADILWRNRLTGDNYTYFMNGTSVAAEGYLRTVADQNWQVVGVGDFNADGKADILWRSSFSGENYIYFMNGVSIAGEGYLRTVADQNWQVVGVADFDGDGRSDILWRNSATGENYIYPMAGLTILPTEGYIRTVADQNWQTAGVGDFDGDGRSDILWRNSSTGENYVYAMAGLTILPTEGYIRTVADLDWRVERVADFDGDGRSDILWRNSFTGENYIYPMAGLAILSTEGYIRAVSEQAWNIAPCCVAHCGAGPWNGTAGGEQQGETPIVSTVSGLLNHQATVTITGAGFGSKPQAAPVVWDDASTGTLVTDGGKWDGYYPIFPDESTTYHLRYTEPIRGIALPHSHLSRYIAGGHGESGLSGATVMFWRNRTMGAFPQYTYISWYQRADDNWVFSTDGGDNNYKMYDFSTGDLPYNAASNWYTAFEPPLPDSPSAPAKWAVNDDFMGQACQSLAWPDNNGHNFFWKFGVNPFSGVWSKVEMEIKWTNQSDGYVKQWQDGVLVINYSGPTDRYGGTARTESVGGYARMYGEPNNWRYWADVYLDYSPARVVLANDANLGSATIREVQIPSSWSDGSINVTVNLGKFTAGQTAYLFVFGPTGVPNAAGFPVTVE